MSFSHARFRALFAAPLVWMLLVAAAAADDSIWTSPENRCSIALPNADWKTQTPPEPDIKWLAVNSDQTKAIDLAVFDSRGMAALERSGFDEGYLKAVNAKKLKGSDFAVEGRTAYRLVAESPMNGKTLSHVVVAVVSHGRVYRIAAQSIVSDADTDSEINASIKSFHLFDPPEPASAPGPLPPAKDDWVTWFSKNVGGYCLLLLIGLLIFRFATKAARK